MSSSGLWLVRRCWLVSFNSHAATDHSVIFMCSIIHQLHQLHSAVDYFTLADTDKNELRIKFLNSVRQEKADWKHTSWSLCCFYFSLSWLIAFSGISHLRRAHSFGKHSALANPPFLTSQYTAFGFFSLISAAVFFDSVQTIHTRFTQYTQYRLHALLKSSPCLFEAQINGVKLIV